MQTLSAFFFFTALTLLMIRLAYAAMFTRFYEYDDEGFHLITLRSYMTGGDLYEGVFAQYGPLGYQVMGALFRLLGTLPTHDTGRLAALTLWIASSFLLGLAVYRLTKSLLLGIGVQVTVFSMLFSLTSEPMAPGGLLVVLLAAVVAVSVFVVPRHEALGMLLVGVIVSCLVLTKVNVGGFALISLAFASTVLFPVFAGRTVVRILGGFAFVASPYVLMLGNLDQSWVQRYALLVSLSALCLVVATSRVRPRPSFGPKVLRGLLAGLATPVVLVVGLTLVQGTSVGGFVNGFLLNALRQPDIFTIPLPLPPSWVLVLAGASVITALVVARRAPTGKLGGIVAGAAAIAGGFVIWLALQGPAPFGQYSLWLALPLASFSLLTAPPDEAQVAYVLIPSIAVLQVLHAYPVAGSQLSWGTFLLVPVGAMAISGGIRALPPALGPSRLAGTTRAVLIGIPVAMFVFWLYASSFVTVKSMVDAQRIFPSLDLPGARRLRLSPDQAAVLRGVTEGLRQNCSTFISLPGLNSFYLFAQQDPPTGLNQSGWMYVFDSQLQREIVQEVRTVDDLCLLRHAGVLDFWKQGRPLPRRPLVAYMEKTFVPYRSWGGFELLVRSPD